VDVASGVETSPGKKDRKKMIEFIKKAKSVKELTIDE
jgi:phosphoribosylanthranilate isomerase